MNSSIKLGDIAHVLEQHGWMTEMDREGADHRVYLTVYVADGEELKVGPGDTGETGKLAEVFAVDGFEVRHTVGGFDKSPHWTPRRGATSSEIAVEILRRIGTAAVLIDLDDVQNKLLAAGVPAWIDTLGGGSITLHVGVGVDDPTGHGGSALMLGPGYYLGDDPAKPVVRLGDDNSSLQSPDRRGTAFALPTIGTPASIAAHILSALATGDPAGLYRDVLESWMVGDATYNCSKHIAELNYFPDRWNIVVEDADGLVEDMNDLLRAAIHDGVLLLGDGVGDVEAWRPWTERDNPGIAYMIQMRDGTRLATPVITRSGLQTGEGLEGADLALHLIASALRVVHAEVGGYLVKTGQYPGSGR